MTQKRDRSKSSKKNLNETRPKNAGMQDSSPAMPDPRDQEEFLRFKELNNEPLNDAELAEMCRLLALDEL